ncbi:ATPase domain-containing protein [Paludisphaera mucosa]|uniref:non-specific serine/threonine protein kinase n=1 Tax=Paludisphaera mucosa TaxID=3030827 RepID=A0ABT6F9P0_9BACT|nr:ATPase domain-containing protein [Paludisphaera mucosa]MDG3004232.1 ATPase domain-containing protein [Paludisphaera mucosa]
MAQADLIQTGVSGLDEILLGGIPKGNLILVEGSVGTGKTLIGLEFIYRGAVDFDEPGVVVLFETSPQKLIRDTDCFGWDFDELQREGRVKFVFTTPQVLSQEVRSPDSLLLEAVSEIGAHRIFIDGVSLLQAVAVAPNGVGGLANYREMLQLLAEAFQRENLTVMLSHEMLANQEHSVALEVSEYVADTVIVLRREYRRRGMFRSLEVKKSRGQNYDTGLHTLRIEDGRGLLVFRRVQARVRRMESHVQPTSLIQRSAIGFEPLDVLMGGGLLAGSVTMLVGVSGIGKSVFGAQLLVEGAKNQGKSGLLVSVDEHPAQILRNARLIGLDLQEHVDSGMVQLLYENPQELEIDVHFDRIIRAIEEQQIDRLVIDSMTNYSMAVQDPQMYRDFCHALVGYCKQRLMTTFLNCENPELFGISSYTPDFPIAPLLDNIILLNFVELGDTMHRAMTVAKARGSNHGFVTREFEIGQGGITLVPIDEGQVPVRLPFASYQNLLSRAPTRMGAVPVVSGE